jgi:hypothetical protein
VALTAFAFARGRAGLDALTEARVLGVVGLAALARAAGFFDFLTVFAAGLRLVAGRLRAAVFFTPVRPRPAALRAPLVFLLACPDRRRGARVAFRLAMGRPFVVVAKDRSLP